MPTRTPRHARSSPIARRTTMANSPDIPFDPLFESEAAQSTATIRGGLAQHPPDHAGGTGAGIVPDPTRWRALGVIAIAQLMVILDLSIVNLALPSAKA